MPEIKIFSDPPRSVRKRLMLPLALMILLLMTGAGALLWIQYRQEIIKDSTAVAAEVQIELQTLVEQMMIRLQSLGQSIASNSVLPQFLEQEDQEKLNNLWQPIFQALRENRNVTHMNFLNRQRTVLLRLHQPDYRGDTVQRATLLEAEKTGQMAAGFEFGRVGSFTLRVVQPVYHGQVRVGFVELGLEFEEIIRLLPVRSKSQLAVLLPKNNLEKTAWEDGLRLAGKSGNWDFLTNFVLIYPTSEQLPKTFAQSFNRDPVLSNQSREMRLGDQNWHIFMLSLRDMGLHDLGHLLVLCNVTEARAALARLWVLGGSIGSVLLTVLFGFVYVLLRRTDDAVLKQSQHLREQTSLLASVRRAQSLFISGHDPAGVYEELLQILVQATDSEYGFLDEVRYEADGTPYKLSLALSNIAWDEESRNLYEALVARRKEFRNQHNLSMAPVKEARIIIANDVLRDHRFQGLPDGHPPLHSFIGIPLFSGDAVIGLAGVANRKGGYTQEVADQMQPLAQACAAMIWAQRMLQRNQEYLEALEASETQYRRMAETANEGIWAVDAEFKTTYVNAQLGAMLGYEPQALLGQSMAQFIAPKDLVSHEQPMISHREGKAVRYECCFRHRNGSEVWVIVSATALQDASGNFAGSFAMLTDITLRRQEEQKRLMLEKHLQQMQKVDSLNRMAGAVAHHFNNQLQVVMGNLEIALMVLPSDAPAISSLKDAMQASCKAAEVSGHMLTYLGQTNDRHELLDLAMALSRHLPILQTAIPQNVQVIFDLVSPGPLIRGNANQLQQAVTNLVTNAWEAIGGGLGSIMIQLQGVSAEAVPEAGRFPLDWKPQTSEYACLSIQDTGCGISEQDCGRLFDPFYTTKFTGRGLGLPVVLGIMRAHAGAVGVTSTPEQGSTFRLFLPLASESSADLKLSEQLSVCQPGKSDESAHVSYRGQILVVEDELAVRRMTVSMLEHLGYQVQTAENGHKAVTLFQQEPDSVTGVLCDLTMPGMDGWATIAALRAIRADVRIILTSGYDQVQVMSGEHSEWPQAFLGKPYGLENLKQALAAALKS